MNVLSRCLHHESLPQKIHLREFNFFRSCKNALYAPKFPYDSPHVQINHGPEVTFW